MRLHRALALGFLLCGGIASADSVVEQPKTADSSGRMKKDATQHFQLFVEQKDAPTMSKTATRTETAPRLFSKSKD